MAIIKNLERIEKRATTVLARAEAANPDLPKHLIDEVRDTLKATQKSHAKTPDYFPMLYVSPGASDARKRELEEKHQVDADKYEKALQRLATGFGKTYAALEQLESAEGFRGSGGEKARASLAKLKDDVVTAEIENTARLYSKDKMPRPPRFTAVATRLEEQESRRASQEQAKKESFAMQGSAEGVTAESRRLASLAKGKIEPGVVTDRYSKGHLEAALRKSSGNMAPWDVAVVMLAPNTEDTKKAKARLRRDLGDGADSIAQTIASRTPKIAEAMTGGIGSRQAAVETLYPMTKLPPPPPRVPPPVSTSEPPAPSKTKDVLLLQKAKDEAERREKYLADNPRPGRSKKAIEVNERDKSEAAYYRMIVNAIERDDYRGALKTAEKMTSEYETELAPMANPLNRPPHERMLALVNGLRDELGMPHVAVYVSLAKAKRKRGSVPDAATTPLPRSDVVAPPSIKPAKAELVAAYQAFDATIEHQANMSRQDGIDGARAVQPEVRESIRTMEKAETAYLGATYPLSNEQIKTLSAIRDESRSKDAAAPPPPRRKAAPTPPQTPAPESTPEPMPAPAPPSVMPTEAETPAGAAKQDRKRLLAAYREDYAATIKAIAVDAEQKKAAIELEELRDKYRDVDRDRESSKSRRTKAKNAELKASAKSEEVRKRAAPLYKAMHDAEAGLRKMQDVYVGPPAIDPSERRDQLKILHVVRDEATQAVTQAAATTSESPAKAPAPAKKKAPRKKAVPRLKEVISETEYRKHKIVEQDWIVKGKPRRVFVVDTAHAPDGHYDSIEDAQRAIRRRKPAPTPVVAMPEGSTRKPTETNTYPEKAAFRWGATGYPVLDIDTGKVVYVKEKPKGVPSTSGPGSAGESYTVLSYDNDPPSQRDVDLGIVRGVAGKGIKFRPPRKNKKKRPAKSKKR